MQDRMDAGHVRFRTDQIQNRPDAGYGGWRTGWMQDRTDDGQIRCRA